MYPVFIHNRRRRKQLNQTGNQLAGLTGLGCSVVFSLGFVFSVVIMAFVYQEITRDLPGTEVLSTYFSATQPKPFEPARLYDRDGTQIIQTLENPAVAGNKYLKVSQTGGAKEGVFSSGLISATVAILEPGFWNGSGFSTSGIQEGEHPTIAQRLVDDLILWDEPAGIRRNVRERILAAQVTARYGHAQVLEWYLNSTKIGDLIYGADAAARAYFGKSADQLSLAEGVLLAVVADSPDINPYTAPQIVLERQRVLLTRMQNLGLISQKEARQAQSEQLNFRKVENSKNIAPAFTELVLEQLEDSYPLDQLARSGMRVVTTLDYDLQLQARCIALTQIQRLAGNVHEVLTENGQPCKAARLLPTLPRSSGQVADDLSASILVFDPDSAQILSMLGDSSVETDPSISPGRPGGTILTPFIYLTAFTRGFSPGSLVWDLPEPVDEMPIQLVANPIQAEPELIQNYHGPMRLRLALANDYLSPVKQIIDQIGSDNVWRTLNEFGLSLNNTRQDILSPDDVVYDQKVSLLSLVRAYGVLANQGLMTGRSFQISKNDEGIKTGDLSDEENETLDPITILRIEDSSGRLLDDWTETHAKPIVSPQLAYLIMNVLSDEAARWPELGHPNPLEIGRPAATKWGSTPEEQDAWTVGYIPQFGVGVWVGSQSEGRVSPNVAAAIWHAMVQYASQDLPSINWTIPPGIVSTDVCDPSGLLPTAICPTKVSEVYLPGNEPTEMDNLYRLFKINRETGRLASAFTPPELVDEQVYLLLPPQALQWAEQAGLPIPPESYDLMVSPPPTSADVSIVEPVMFSHVHGKVDIIGSAAGDGFVSYRLLVGQGLNPQAWIQIGDDAKKPVSNGRLGVWDVESLSGLYTIRLQVIYRSQRIETFILQVTVDNTPPNMSIEYPHDRQTLSYQTELPLVIQLNSQDELGVAKIEVYVDDRLIATLSQPPYLLPWMLMKGEHTLRVIAYDLTGNQTTDEVNFSVVE